MTVRQRQVLALYAHGMTLPEIAAELGITYETVRGHAARVRELLQARTMFEAVAVAYQTGLLP